MLLKHQQNLLGFKEKPAMGYGTNIYSYINEIVHYSEICVSLFSKMCGLEHVFFIVMLHTIF